MDNVKKLIEAYDTIIIHRHTRPDLDAMGSQIGLSEAIKATYPSKKVYIVGEENKYQFVGKMDTISDDVYKDALAIITDVAVKALVSDDRYQLAKEILVIDHHTNSSDIENAHMLIDSTFSSASELIATFIFDYHLQLTKKGTTALFGGIVTDTGRFFYPSITDHTFLIASLLIKQGADFKMIYDNLYIEDLESKKMKSYFVNKFEITEHNVAFMMNDLDVFEKFNVDTFTISRGMVNVMSGIEGINIWVNFTYDKENNCVLAEIRSRDCIVLDIAKEYGGGGHNMACGATLKDFDEAKEMLNELDKLSMEVFYGTNN